MIEVGHEDLDDAGALADQITEIATTRLVLLAADEHDSVSFDVRSLQELMAGRALVAGDDTTIATNLRATAPSPHWRNTWLFAAGKLFTEGDHRRSILLDLVERFDTTDRHWPGWLSPIGPALAAHLLEDGLADTKPAALRALASVALRCLNGPLPEDHLAVAYGLNFVARHPALRTLIRSELRAAFAGTPTAVSVATLLWAAMPALMIVPGQSSIDTTQALADQWNTNPPPGPRVRVGKLLAEPLAQLRDEPGAALVKAAFGECNKLALRMMPDGSMWPAAIPPGFTCPRLEAVLADQDAASLLDLCLGDLEPGQWAARSLLARAVSQVLARRPAGDRLTMRYLHA
jgi:hypothetical protein